MPRAEKRRWWLERWRGGHRWIYEIHTNDLWQQLGYTGKRPEWHIIVALWRLVQWQRIRLERAEVRDEIRERAEFHMAAVALSSIVDARCREEEMRVRLEECEYDLACEHGARVGEDE